jgi:hypothetical protein
MHATIWIEVDERMRPQIRSNPRDISKVVRRILLVVCYRQSYSLHHCEPIAW